jgi:hypothetical protein
MSLRSIPLYAIPPCSPALAASTGLGPTAMRRRCDIITWHFRVYPLGVAHHTHHCPNYRLSVRSTTHDFQFVPTAPVKVGICSIRHVQRIGRLGLVERRDPLGAPPCTQSFLQMTVIGMSLVILLSAAPSPMPARGAAIWFTRGLSPRARAPRPRTGSPARPGSSRPRLPCRPGRSASPVAARRRSRR